MDAERVVDADAVPGAAAEQLVDRQVERLPLQIPEGNVYCGDGKGYRTASSDEVQMPPHLVPKLLGAEDVFADQI